MCSADINDFGKLNLRKVTLLSEISNVVPEIFIFVIKLFFHVSHLMNIVVLCQT